MTSRACVAVVLTVATLSRVMAQELSPPQGVTLSVYDVGFALVNELRRVTLAAGESDVVARDVPSEIDVASATLSPVGTAGDFTLGEKRFEYDLGSPYGLLNRYRGREITVSSGGVDLKGVLVGAPQESRTASPLVLETPAGVDAIYGLDQVRAIKFPQARQGAFTSPTLLWTLSATRAGPQQVRLSYLARGLSWDAFHEIVLLPGGATAHLYSRVWLENKSGGRFEDARIRLITTEKGMREPVFGAGASATDSPGQRFAYGAADPSYERTVAGYAPQAMQALPSPVTLAAGASAYVSLAGAQNVPVSRFFVYDGVRFDRFQRNRRNDWNYGTEYHPDVETHIEIENTTQGGLGVTIPAGTLRLYQMGEGEVVDLLGEDILQPSTPGGKIHARVGPSRGLRGERERTGYTEVKPLHEYEESFEIRLENATKDDVEVRVVEHLYRWPDFEIVKADAEYTKTGPQTIEFRPPVKAGGSRSVHYTVRYRW